MYTGKPEGGRSAGDYVEDYHKQHLDADSLYEDLISGTEKLIKELEEAVASLPPPDTPYAEHFWARKEELEGRAESSLSEIQAGLAAVEKELQRCQRNVDRISGDKSLLNLEKAVTSYDEAEQAQRDQHRKVQRQRDKLVEVLSRLQAALNRSRAKKWPGKEPQERPDFPIPPLPGQGPEPGGTIPTPPPPPRPGGGPSLLGPELDGLLELGPQRGNGPAGGGDGAAGPSESGISPGESGP